MPYKDVQEDKESSTEERQQGRRGLCYQRGGGQVSDMPRNFQNEGHAESSALSVS